VTSLTYTSSARAEIAFIERRLKESGVPFKKSRTKPQTYTAEGVTVEVGTSRPWNIRVEGDGAERLRAILAELPQRKAD
jgi:hypothetical protein